MSIFSWWPLVRSSNDSSSHDDADEWPASTSSNDKSSLLFTAVCLFDCSERSSNKSVNDEVWYWRRLLGDRIWWSASMWRMCAARLSVYISGISFVGGTRSHRNNFVSSIGLPRTKSKPQRWLAANWCLASSSSANLIETKNDQMKIEFCTEYQIMEIFYVFLVCRTVRHSIYYVSYATCKDLSSTTARKHVWLVIRMQCFILFIPFVFFENSKLTFNRSNGVVRLFIYFWHWFWSSSASTRIQRELNICTNHINAPTIYRSA